MKKWNLDKKRMRVLLWGALVVGIAFGVGRFGAAPRGSGGDRVHDQRHDADGAQTRRWTCSMHPQIRLPKPGKCPICFMDLIPVDFGVGADGADRVVAVSAQAARLMEIETSPVERRAVQAEVRMIGKVAVDESRVSHITSWVPGRLERLFVDYTGITVQKGDHMVVLYSPELLSAQEELLQTARATRSLQNRKDDPVSESAEATVAAVRAKLRLWGLTPQQISAIEARGQAEDRVTIYAPIGGVVVDMNAREGMYVETGTRIYTIADLSHVWVNLAAYESDLEWLCYGQAVSFTTEAYPGEVFNGKIVFIAPVLDEATRTVQVRVNVSNEDQRLKPGMFVRADARADLAADGRVVRPSMVGKWICPMHPEIVKDAVGSCDICGMPLVSAEHLGVQGTPSDSHDLPLVIPSSAPLVTGKRAVVYVALPDRDAPTFKGREVVLGPRAGDVYLVKEGLAEGERVVTRGAFKLDAELQIRAQPSMMSPSSSDVSEDADVADAGTDQTHCPVMGGLINRDVYTDYNGMRIYFCCEGCEQRFLSDSETYLAKMRAAGVTPERIGEHRED